MNIQKKAFTVLFFAAFVFWFSGAAFADTDPVFSLPTASFYGDLGDAGDPLPAKAALRGGTLPNGLRYYILENALPAGRAYLTLAVNAGSILEEDDERGLAHFVEHMAFNGTRRFPGTELVNYLRSLGMRFGPEVNAYTGFEETVYGIETPVETGADGTKRIPDKSLAILDDWIWGVSFEPEAVNKERSVVMEEYRSDLGATERVRRQILPVIFRGSRFAERLPIGLPEVIQNAPVEKLTGFYQKWYRPDNMALIFVGDFNGEALEKDLAAHFTVPSARTPFSRPRFELPDPQKGSVTTAIVTDDELAGSTAYLYYKRSPLPRTTTLQTYRQNLVDYLIELMVGFRYEEKIASENTPYMGAASWTSRYGQSSRYYILAASAKADRTGETLKALFLEKEAMLRYGFLETELERAKAALVSYLETAEAEKDKRRSDELVTELTADFLKEQFALDLDWELRAVGQMLPAISLGAVNRAARAYFADDDVTVIITAPQKEAAGLPDEKAVSLMVEESRNAAITPPKERELISSFIDEAAASGSIVSVVEDPSGAELLELSNGMRVILMPTSNKNNELDVYALARGGISSAAAFDGASAGGTGQSILAGLDFSAAEAYNSAKLASELKGASGLGPLSRPNLMDFLSDKQVSLSFWTSYYTRGLRGSSSAKDLPVLFQLLYGTFTAPRIDENGFALVKDYHTTRLLQDADNPDVYFSKELTRFVYSGNPVFMPLELADMDTINQNAALAFLTLALNPADYTVVFTGSLGDKDAFYALVENWLASIPASDVPRWNEWSDPNIERPKNAERVIRKGKEEKSAVYMGWFVPASWTEADNAAALCLNEYLDIVLTDEIRETLGGVYSISVAASLSPMPRGELSLEVYFACDPKREAELRQAVKAQLASLAEAADGETFIRAKEALLKTFESSMENNGFIARNLANFSVIAGTPLSRLAERPALYRSITGEQIRDLTRALLDGGPCEMVLMPESADNQTNTSE